VQRSQKSCEIEPASPEWASPVVLVAKPDGNLRLYVDYRKLNAVATRDTYPLPRMDECIKSLLDEQFSTMLDCNSGYWHIPIAPEDVEKTTFTSHEGNFQFTRMPFGLRNAPANFQRTVDIVLSGLRWKTCIVYLDDIIVFSNSSVEHSRHLYEGFSLLYEEGLSLKLAKCTFSVIRSTVSAISSDQ
jgi:hypothetical protein